MPLTLPNLLTLARIAAIVPLTAAYFLPSPLGPWLVLALFAAAGLTDFLDGWAARRRGLETAFGRFLDPVADKLLTATLLTLLAADGRAPAVAVVVVLCRELAVAALREEMARRGASVAVSRLAKGKTAAQMTAIALLLAAEPAAGLGVPPDPVLACGAAVLWLAAALAAVSAAAYMRAAAARLRARGAA